jgi:hypothetical protein
MSNHVHWIVIPDQPDSLAKAFGEAHGRYAHYANALRNRSEGIARGLPGTARVFTGFPETTTPIGPLF